MCLSPNHLHSPLSSPSKSYTYFSFGIKRPRNIPARLQIIQVHSLYTTDRRHPLANGVSVCMFPRKDLLLLSVERCKYKWEEKSFNGRTKPNVVRKEIRISIWYLPVVQAFLNWCDYYLHIRIKRYFTDCDSSVLKKWLEYRLNKHSLAWLKGEDL